MQDNRSKRNLLTGLHGWNTCHLAAAWLTVSTSWLAVIRDIHQNTSYTTWSVLIMPSCTPAQMLTYEVHHNIPATTFSFCLTGLFFREPLQLGWVVQRRTFVYCWTVTGWTSFLSHNQCQSTKVGTAETILYANASGNNHAYLEQDSPLLHGTPNRISQGLMVK